MRSWLLVMLCLLPSASFATTAPSLTDRIAIDGWAADYAADEWILDATTPFAESARDSRWGSDNDVSALAATWDQAFLYFAVSGVTHDSELMLLIEHAPGGVSSLQSLDPFRRAISFHRFTPNLIVHARAGSNRARVGRIDAQTPLTVLPEGELATAFVRTPDASGLEIALPWQLVAGPTGTLRVLVVITGGDGTGSGDAAPDPGALLDSNRFRLAYLDNAVEVTYDANGDGNPDMGVSPRDAAVALNPQGSPEANVAALEVEVERKAFAPDEAEVVRFQVGPAGGVTARLYLSARVYTADGRAVRALFENEARSFAAGATPAWDIWDGRDATGTVVRGGIYIIAVSGGLSGGSVSDVERFSVAVIR